MNQQYSYLERIVTVEHGREVSYFGHVVLDMQPGAEPYEWVPNTTIYETHEDVVILMELAGLGSEDVLVTVDGDRIILRGRRLLPASQPVSHYHHIEIPTGNFQKVIRFRYPIAAELVRTAMKDGLLEIRVPNAGLCPR